MLWPWNAAALPEIMARAGQDGKLHVAPWPCGKAGPVCLFRFTKAEQQADNLVALPEPEAVELRNPTEA